MCLAMERCGAGEMTPCMERVKRDGGTYLAPRQHLRLGEQCGQRASVTQVVSPVKVIAPCTGGMGARVSEAKQEIETTTMRKTTKPAPVGSHMTPGFCDPA